MRFILPLAALVLFALPVRADDDLDCAKGADGVLHCAPITVQVDPPHVQLMIPRDSRAKQDVETLGKDHLDDAARRK